MSEDDLNELDEHARSFLPSRGLALLARLRAALADERDRRTTLEAHLSDLAEICTDRGWLLTLLDDPSPLVREGAVYGLAKLGGGGGGVERRLRAVAESDPSPSVRAAAAEALDP